MRVAIIGAGASGLVTLKYLIQASRDFATEPIEVLLFEKKAEVGGAFRYRAYEDGELVSSRFLTLFSDFRLPESSPDFISLKAYCDYLEAYCDEFNLRPYIRFNTTVQSVRRKKQGTHVVTVLSNDSAKEEQWSCDAIAVCTGLHVTPNVPAVEGIENVPDSLHSSAFKERKQFGKDKNIMVLGAGETAMDMAYLAVTSPTHSVTLCHRGGWKNEPKRLPDPIWYGDVEAREEDLRQNGEAPPTDTAHCSLFDTAYLHPALEAQGWPWTYHDLFVLFYSWLNTGTSCGIDQWIGEIQGKRHKSKWSLANKSNRTQPFMSAPYRPEEPSTVERWRSSVCKMPEMDLKGRHVEVAPWPDYIDKAGVVHFKDNGRLECQRIKEKNIVCQPDVVVFATGYTQIFPFFDETYPTIFDADIRRVWKTGVEDVGFIGFVRPSFGAIPPLAELQAQLWVLNLFSRLPQPLRPVENYILNHDFDRRADYIVDHDTFAYRMACDMGTATSLFQALSFGPKVFLTWALTPQFNTKFRLVGPWKWDGAAAIMKGELWRVMNRRKGSIVWIFESLVPIILFGTLSLLYYIFYNLKDTLLWPLLFVGLHTPTSSTHHERSHDLLGAKKARAVKEARITREAFMEKHVRVEL